MLYCKNKNRKWNDTLWSNSLDSDIYLGLTLKRWGLELCQAKYNSASKYECLLVWWISREPELNHHLWAFCHWIQATTKNICKTINNNQLLERLLLLLQQQLQLHQSLSLSLYTVYIYLYIHTHTIIYIYHVVLFHRSHLLWCELSMNSFCFNDTFQQCYSMFRIHMLSYISWHTLI